MSVRTAQRRRLEPKGDALGEEYVEPTGLCVTTHWGTTFVRFFRSVFIADNTRSESSVYDTEGHVRYSIFVY